MSVPFHVNVCLSSRRVCLTRLTRGSPTWGKTFFPNARVEQSFSLVRKEELALRAESHATLLVCRKRRDGLHFTSIDVSSHSHVVQQALRICARCI